jgi:hypothetical protein
MLDRDNLLTHRDIEVGAQDTFIDIFLLQYWLCHSSFLEGIFSYSTLSIGVMSFLANPDLLQRLI